MTQKIKQQPPNDLIAEQSLLGAFILDNSTFLQFSDSITEIDFYKTAHGKIFAAIKNLMCDMQPVDATTLMGELERMGILEKCGGGAYLSELEATCPTPKNAAAYLAEVLECARLREIARGAALMVTDAIEHKNRATDVLSAFNAIVAGMPGCPKAGRRVGEVCKAVLDEIEKLPETGTVTGIPSGFPGLDAIMNGWQRKNLAIIGARTSHGKTSFVLQTAGAMSLDGLSGFIFSLEMSAEQCVKRMMAQQAFVSGSRLSRRELSEQEWKLIGIAVKKISGMNLWIDDRSRLSVEEMASAIFREHARHPLDFVIVDYIQLISGHFGEKRYLAIGEALTTLRDVAKQLNFALIVASQANPPQYGEKQRPPKLSDLRDSKEICNRAQQVILLYLPKPSSVESEKKNGCAEGAAFVRKNTYGGCDGVNMIFHQAQTLFEEIEEGEKNTNTEEVDPDEPF